MRKNLITKDAYGQELWNHYKGKDTSEIVERDDGYIDIGPGPKLYFAKFKDWPKDERQGIKFAKGRVLDIGCGAGRHSLYLQNKGFDVVGIDSSPLAIRICKLRGLKKAKVMEIIEIGNFEPNTYDSIIMLGNNFGLFGSFTRAKSLLKKMHTITSQNAVIIASSRDPTKTDDINHLEYHQLNRKRGRMSGQVRIRVRFKKCVGDWLDYLFVSKKEMVDILNGTGWRLRRCIDSKYGQYVAVIEKTKKK